MSNRFSAIIIDDEPLARSIVREYLASYDVDILDECGDGFEGIKAITAHKPDLLFLDIQLPKINGFEMLEVVDDPPPVIFTTAFEEYAMKAFESHAVDYLLKPFGKERFDKAMQKWSLLHGKTPSYQPLLEAAATTPSQQERVVVRDGSKIRIIPVSTIRYVEAADDYAKIHTAEGAFLKNRTMRHFEELLPPQQFVRIHRSYILNVQLITRIEPYEKENHLALLKDGDKLPVSKTGYARLREVLGI